MFRENVLVRDDIIARVSETMVPVALDYQKVLDRKSRESRFVRSMIKGDGDIQGVRIIAPDQKILGSFSGFGDMAGKTKRMIDDALEEFGSVEKRRVPEGQADPARGVGFRSDGRVCLAEYVRRLDRDKIKSPVISNIPLSKTEFMRFAPPKPAVGETWTVPDAVAKKFCRAASPMCYQHAPQPEWVKSVILKGRVLGFENGLAKLGYEGKLSSERIWQGDKILSQQEMTFQGEGLYEPASGEIRSLVMVGSGTFRWPEEDPDKLVPFEALVEWASAPVPKK